MSRIGRGKGICKPSVKSEKEGCTKTGPEGSPGCHSPSVAVTVMVPHVVRSLNTCNLPAEDQAIKQSTADDTDGRGATSIT